ncbi:MAG TPA: anti-sigma factor [Candidatus Xenobia bacterium]|nr:anti-sigma factor [Candidatus Xenobia bacterium]
MNAHPQAEDLDLLALGALDPDERRPLEAHLRDCAECRQALDKARGRAALLALSAPAETPAPRVKQQLLERIRPKPAAAPVSAFRAWFQQASPTFALATLVLFASTAWLGYRSLEMIRLNEQARLNVLKLQDDLRKQEKELARARAVLEVMSAPDAVRVTLMAAQARPVPQGRAFYHPRKGLVFTAANLAALPEGKTYQLWLIPMEGKPISAGVFDPDAQGAGTILLPPLPEGVAAKAFAVTVEPSGGVPQPTGPIVLVGNAS